MQLYQCYKVFNIQCQKHINSNTLASKCKHNECNKRPKLWYKDHQLNLPHPQKQLIARKNEMLFQGLFLRHRIPSGYLPISHLHLYNSENRSIITNNTVRLLTNVHPQGFNRFNLVTLKFLNTWTCKVLMWQHFTILKQCSNKFV